MGKLWFRYTETNLDKLPWHLFCGGSIISENYIHPNIKIFNLNLFKQSSTE